MKADASEIRGLLLRVSEELAYMNRVLDTESQSDAPDVVHVLNTYLAMRRTLSAELSMLAVRTIVEDPVVLNETILEIEAAMSDAFADEVPERLLKVKGYRGVHGVLLEYLIRHVGTPVSGSLLRLLAGEQVHTERRLRELRDLGYNVTVENVSGENMYEVDPVPDIRSAAMFQIRANVKAAGGLSKVEKTAILAAIAG